MIANSLRADSCAFGEPGSELLEYPQDWCTLGALKFVQ